jgi:CobQ-like glutamine amidotransferase family enzyme
MEDSVYKGTHAFNLQKKILIAHLYPREMSIYGDIGNVITLKRRLQWRGYSVEVKPVEIGEPYDFSDVDLVFGGGGQDSGQSIIAVDLLERGEDIRKLVSDGVPMLVICGMYQLFGRGFTTIEGRKLPGIDVFRATTTGGGTRMIGNVVVDSHFGRLVGFENHSGQTMLEHDQAPLGVVKKGFGNNTTSHREGSITNNAIGTYMHGPLLPKNPVLADHLLLSVLKRKFKTESLDPLNDELELAAALVAAKRPQ